jgi:thioredoxin 1
MKDITNFTTEVRESKGLIVVKFFANWCGPCKMLIPVMERVEQANTDVHFVQVDVDKHRDLIKELGINSVPVVQILKDGLLINQIDGLKLQRNYQEAIDNAKLL